MKELNAYFFLFFSLRRADNNIRGTIFNEKFGMQPVLVIRKISEEEIRKKYNLFIRKAFSLYFFPFCAFKLFIWVRIALDRIISVKVCVTD